MVDNDRGHSRTVITRGRASIESIRHLLEPRSVAVIGASRRPGSIGNKVFQSIMHAGFSGAAYPVNPNTDVVASVKAYPSVADIPGPVDLAIIVIPAELVPEAIEECGRKGVKGIVLITAGFGEMGGQGEQKQQELVQTIRKYGMRLVGPNCMGVLNTDPRISLNGTFSAVFPPQGSIAFATQSGALGLAILDYAKNINVGLSTFLSIGNRADISSNDLLQYWAEDPATKIILLYLESFGNPRRFVRISRKVARSKPIIVVKSGRTPAGVKAAASHTGAIASTEVVSDALFTQAGMIRVDTLVELFDLANLLANQPVPNGKWVGVLTNGGGPGIMTADACASRGLLLPALSPQTLAGLKSFLPPRATFANPVDMTAEATGSEYTQALRLLAQDPNVDIVIVIFIPPVPVEVEDVAAAIRNVASEFRRADKVLVASFLGSRGSSGDLGTPGDCCVPSYAFPEDAAIAISKACEYRQWLNRPVGKVSHFSDVDREKARNIVRTAFAHQKPPFWLDSVACFELLSLYGIPSAPVRQALSADGAAKAAREVGFPVAVKVVAPTVSHKTEVGGVILNLRDEAQVKTAFKQIKQQMASLGREAEMQGVIVQHMVEKGTEVICGVTQDRSFGHLIMFGMGGIYTELFKDVVFRVHPLTDIDAREMVSGLKVSQVLQGWRGAPPADVKSLEGLLLRLSALIEDLPQITELDLNPVKALESGYQVVDARILIGGASQPAKA